MAKSKRLTAYKGEAIKNYVFILKEYQFRKDASGYFSQVHNRDQQAFHTPTGLRQALKDRMLSLMATRTEFEVRFPAARDGVSQLEFFPRSPDVKIEHLRAIKRDMDITGALLKKNDVDRAIRHFNKFSRNCYGCTLSYEVLRYQDKA